MPYGLWQTWPQVPYPAASSTQDHSHSLAMNLTHTFSPTMTNQITFTANNLFYGASLSTPDKVSASKLGYPYQGVYKQRPRCCPQHRRRFRAWPVSSTRAASSRNACCPCFMIQ